MSDMRITAAFTQQSIACGDLGSPFMAQLMRLFAERIEPDCTVTRSLINWPGDLGPAAESIPLRIAGALHALKLLGKEILGRVYPPADTSDDVLWEAVHATMRDETEFILSFITSAPQTNEVRRSSAIIAAAHWITAHLHKPLVTREIGASAGLNLNWDRYCLNIGDHQYGDANSPVQFHPEWRGQPLVGADVDVIDRLGIDLNPINSRDPAQELRLLSYLWPDQPERMTLTRGAIGLATETVIKMDAVKWLQNEFTLTQNATTMLYSTIAWQYLPREARDRGEAVIETIGASTTNAAPLAWFTMEGDATPGSAALTVRLWPGDLRIKLGRADYHGRWIEWTPPV